MQEISLKARAKINLGLDVIGRRENGYHELRMIMQTVDLADQVTVRRTQERGIRLVTNQKDLPTDTTNLAVRAAQLLRREFALEDDGLTIELEKHIPMAAGLAGGSTDAAAVLRAVNQLYHLALSDEDLMARGVTLGADVPYCVMQGSALAEGIGDRLTRLPAPPSCHILLAKPEMGISTREVYTALDALGALQHPDIDGQLEALAEGDLEKLCASMGNVLEYVTIPRCPEVGRIKDIMRSGGAVGAMMSGSGPTVFGLFADEEKARETMQTLEQHTAAEQVFLTGFFHPGQSIKEEVCYGKSRAADE